MANKNMVKHKQTGELYEIQHVIYSRVDAVNADADVLACYRLSAYDGMPIGSLVHLQRDEVE
jgi:hypothetical protein